MAYRIDKIRHQAAPRQAAPAGAGRGCRLSRRVRSRPPAISEICHWRLDRRAREPDDQRPTGVGKSWLACALGHKSYRDNRTVLYQRVPKLCGELALARGGGRYARITHTLGNVQLSIAAFVNVNFAPRRHWVREIGLSV
jgi:hypothetical protein